MSRTNTASYWCYRCTRFIRLTSESAVTCPHCDGGFIESVDSNEPPPLGTRRRFPSSAMYMLGNNTADHHRSDPRPHRRRRHAGDRSPFNPVIVLRGGASNSDRDNAGERGFELYYDDGAGTGLQPLPETMSEFLMGSGFDRLLEQLSQIEVNGLGLGLGRSNHPPASKSAIESMPVIEISDIHVTTESHCAVCKEPFAIRSEAREMPCKHIYHPECILPWLNLRNSCPVCRYEIESDTSNSIRTGDVTDATDLTNSAGLTIWRLPGGGFAVGRFSGGRRTGGGGGEREVPVVYTEMDGGFNNNSGTPRRIMWESRRSNVGGETGIRRVFRNVVSFFGRIRPNSSSGSNSGAISRSRSLSSSVFGRMTRRRSRTWIVDEQNGLSRM